MTPEDVRILAADGYANPAYFCQMFLAEWFTLPMPWVHRGVLAIRTQQVSWLEDFRTEYWPKGEFSWDVSQLDKIRRHFVRLEDPEDKDSRKIPLFEYVNGQLTLLVGPKILVILPRGVSKTTLMNGMNVRDICYKDLKFLLYVSEAAPHSEAQLATVKRQLEINPRLRTVFGNKVPERNASERWTDKQIETVDNVKVAARGRGGQVRGLLAHSERPDHIVFDDLEDSESVLTDAQIKKTMAWFKADLEPVLPQIGETGRLTGLGTILSPNALIVSLAKDPEFITVKFGAMDPDGDPVWSGYMTKQQYIRKKLSYQRVGQLQKFHMEYDSSTDIVSEEATFHSSYIRIQSMRREDFVALALAIDPAISTEEAADYFSAAVVGINQKGRLHVFESFSKKAMSPREQIDKYFELWTRWDCTHAGVESIAYQMALVHLLREEMFRKAKELGASVYHEIQPITHGRTGKIARIKGVLAPRYAAGYVTHDRVFPLLETQLLEFDLESTKKDAPDAVAMAVTLLDPHASWAMDGEESEDGVDKLAQDSMEPLDLVRGCP